MDTIDYKPHPDALYFHIANDALQAACTEKDALRLQQHVATSLVFSALCLEAYINQEFSRHSETAKIIEDDERLRLESKWLLLPLLLGASRTFDKGAGPYQAFSELVTLRNQRLVHFKPHKETLTAVRSARQPRKYLVDLLENIDLAEKYVGCVSKMIKDLHDLTGARTRLPEFLTGHRYSQEVPVSRIVSVNYEALGPRGETK